MVLNLELHAKLYDHSVVEIGTIVCDNPLGYTILTNEVMLNEWDYNILSDGGE